MTLYIYRARSPRGELVEGRLDAESPEQIAARLLGAGITPIDIGLASEREPALKRLARALGLGKPTTADLMLFSRQMHTITKAGVPLLRGLKGLQSSMHNVCCVTRSPTSWRAWSRAGISARALRGIRRFSRRCT